MSPTHRALALAAGSIAGIFWIVLGVWALRYGGIAWVAAPLLIVTGWAAYAVSDMNYQLSKTEPKPRVTAPEW